MRRSSQRLRVLRDERGLSTVEYVLIVALVAIVAFVGWQLLGRSAASRNRAADGVVDGLHTHSTEDEGGASGGSGGRRASGPTGTVSGGSGATMVDAMREEAPPDDAGLWRWGAVALAVFGGMIYWLARDKK